MRNYKYPENAMRKQSVAHIRDLIGQTTPPPKTESSTERIKRVYGFNLRQCSHCKTGCMHPTQAVIPPTGQSP